jgi:cell division septum initiation protein DivIVA
MFGFNNKFVKIKNEDWEDIKTDYNQLVQDNKQLRAQVQAGTSDEIQQLKDIIQKQTESLKNMTKWKDNDDLLFSYENGNQEKLKKIHALESKVTSLENELEDFSFAYKKEAEMSSLLAKKLATYTGTYPQYKTVSKYDIYV